MVSSNHPRGETFQGTWLELQDGSNKPRFRPDRHGASARTQLLEGATAYLQIRDVSELVVLIDDCGFWPLMSAIGQVYATIEKLKAEGKPVPDSTYAWRQVATCYREGRSPQWNGNCPAER